MVVPATVPMVDRSCPPQMRILWRRMLRAKWSQMHRLNRARPTRDRTPARPMHRFLRGPSSVARIPATVPPKSAVFLEAQVAAAVPAVCPPERAKARRLRAMAPKIALATMCAAQALAEQLARQPVAVARRPSFVTRRATARLLVTCAATLGRRASARRAAKAAAFSLCP